MQQKKLAGKAAVQESAVVSIQNPQKPKYRATCCGIQPIKHNINELLAAVSGFPK